MIGIVPLVFLDFVILTEVSFALSQLSEYLTTVEKKKISVLSCKCDEDEPLKIYLADVDEQTNLARVNLFI